LLAELDEHLRDALSEEVAQGVDEEIAARDVLARFGSATEISARWNADERKRRAARRRHYAALAFTAVTATGLGITQYASGKTSPPSPGVAVATEAAAPKVFDRTLVCSTGDGGPSVSGRPAFRSSRHSATLGLTRRYTGGTWPLVYVDSSGAYVDAQHCARTTNRVRLTRKGLPNTPLVFGSVKCPLGRVLVRLRYSYNAGALPVPRGYSAKGGLISAFLAIRSYKTLKPLAFARLTDKGRKLQLYSATSCTI
jgi:hypothetical protein